MAGLYRKRRIVTNTVFLAKVCDKVEPRERTRISTKLMMFLRPRVDSALAIAANQIGIQKRAFIVNEGKCFRYYINPELIETIGEPVEHEEGCLSIPGELHTPMRYPEIKVTDEINGEQTLTGLMAAIWQHEVDHLNGILINGG